MWYGTTVVRTWDLNDGCGNTTDVSQTNYVFDTTAPVAVSVPGPLTNGCINLVSFAVTPAFSDNCSTNLTSGNHTTETHAHSGAASRLLTERNDDGCGDTTHLRPNNHQFDTTPPG